MTAAFAITLSIAAARAETLALPEAKTTDVSKQIAETVSREFYDPSKLPAFDAATGSGSDLSWVKGALSSLGASHTGRYTPDQIDYYELMEIYGPAGAGEKARAVFPPDGKITYPGIGLIPRMLDGKSFVFHVYDGSPAAKAGIKAGDEILGIDGLPFHEIASFAGRVGQSVALRLRRTESAEPITVSVPVSAIEPGRMLRQAIRDSARIVEKDGKKLGYVRLWSYAGRDIGRLLGELLTTAPLKDADGLILDMRGRWGGAPADAAEMFIGRTPPMDYVRRDGKVVGVNVRWAKPMVGLIDSGARSGMEVLAYSLKKAGIPLIGTRTAGALLGGRAFVMDDNSLLLLAVVDVRLDGKRLEGVGVSPDIEVPFDFRYADGADPQLDRAAQVLTERLGG